MDCTALGKRIREERLKLNLTQENLAEDVSLTPAYIGQVERGERNITLEKLIDVVNRLGVSLDYLLSDSVDSNEDSLYKVWCQLMNGKTDKEKSLAINILKLIFNHLENS
ncbi:helix-turn-helix domain-containing protein [Anaerotignum sp.]|uniref:helix-turn-helix domain-containing protein n=1 Tax=Anaerotignum sp. TaxID=2039241 RepID=UPI002714EEA0|nr:helix-turn-helix transcriptional regulator [Anaerotignum sp.]